MGKFSEDMQKCWEETSESLPIIFLTGILCLILSYSAGIIGPEKIEIGSVTNLEEVLEEDKVRTYTYKKDFDLLSSTGVENELTGEIATFKLKLSEDGLSYEESHLETGKTSIVYVTSEEEERVEYSYEVTTLTDLNITSDLLEYLERYQKETGQSLSEVCQERSNLEKLVDSYIEESTQSESKLTRTLNNIFSVKEEETELREAMLSTIEVDKEELKSNEKYVIYICE